MKSFTCAALACIGLLCADSGIAATDQEHVLVTDKLPPARHSLSEVDLANYTGFAQIVDRSQFDHRFVDLGQLLNDLPGIQVAQYGGLGTFSSVSIRGSSGKQVSVFLDGLLLNSPGSGGVNVGTIPSVLIEQIEAYPDFTPIQLGNANLAGAINFRSRQLSDDDIGAQLSLAAGSFGTRNAELSGWGSQRGWQLLGGLSSTRADNDYPVAEELFRTTSKRRQNDGYRQRNGFIKLARDTEMGRLSTLAQYSQSEKELPTTLNQERDNATLDNSSWRLQAVYDYRLGEVDIAHRGFATEVSDLFTDSDSTIGLGEDKTETELRGIGLYNTARWQWGQHEMSLGLELRQDDLDQHDQLEKRKLTSAQRHTAVLAIADNWEVGDQLLLSGAVRHYLQNDSIEFSLSDEAENDRISASSLQLGGQWQVSRSLSLKSNAGLLLRLPTLSEKFGARGLLAGNPELLEEQALSADMGMIIRHRNLRATASVFHRQVDDGIVTIYDSRGIGKPQNIGRSTTTGLESELHWQALTWLAINANATLLDSENHSDIRSSRNKKLPGLYHQSFGAGLTLSKGHSLFKLNYAIHDELFYDPANAVQADKKQQISTEFSHYWQHFIFNLSARNLLDENFLDANRFPTPGRSVIATLTITL